MKVEDAPGPGWYPDPTGGSRLRWWDGLDWADERRPVPSAAIMRELEAAFGSDADTESLDPAALTAQAAARARKDTNEIISQVREIARSEVDRAAEVFGQRAEAAARRIEPLVSEYTSKFIRLVKVVGAVAAVVLVAWFVFQFIIQASFFGWLGDRIDNLTNGE